MGIIIIVLLLASLASLAYALSGLIKPGADAGDRLQRGMRLRVGFSITLFLLLLLAWQAGLIEPHALGDPIQGD